MRRKDILFRAGRRERFNRATHSSSRGRFETRATPRGATSRGKKYRRSISHGGMRAYGARGVARRDDDGESREASVSEDETTRGTGGWTPRAREDFGTSGGAFPEINVVQFVDAEDGAPVSCFGMDYETLRRRAAEAAFDETSTTPEYRGFLNHARRCVDGSGKIDWGSVTRVGGLAGSREVRRARGVDPRDVEAACLRGEGEPLIVEDGGKDWAKWDFETLQNEIGDFEVLCNDRAPARRREIDGSKQRSHLIPFRAYADYVRKRDGVAGTVFDDRRTPFYANGMRVFSECKRADALSRAFPRPYFTHECDNTETLLMATTNELGSILKFDSEIALRMRDSVSKSLDKMFVGPRGALTRLHYDAGDAHGWLGQVEGRKLFVFYPPSASPMLYPIEDSHASVDPLEPDYDRFPLFREAQSRARVCVLNPGEVVLCPRRWWHYAVALDTSVTVMRNWYNVNTNAQALVEQICSTIKQTVDNRAKGSVPRNEASR